MPEPSKIPEAPPGFTREQWQQFDSEGYLILEHRLNPHELQRGLDAFERCRSKHPRMLANTVEAEARGYMAGENTVEQEPWVAGLIDHARHVGFAFDLYGDLTQVHRSQWIWRARGGKCTEWHVDGARIVPFTRYVSELPMTLKVGYWLTDQSEADHGNLTVIPGSHRWHEFSHAGGHRSVPEERQLCFPAGSLTLMHGNIWHRTAEHRGAFARKNFFVSYCPSWLRPGDRSCSDPEWLMTLRREARIMMRGDRGIYAHSRPDPADVPLYRPRCGAPRTAPLPTPELEARHHYRPLAIDRWQKPPGPA